MPVCHTIAILEVTDPGDISIREISGTNEFTEFDRLNHELASVLDTDSSYIQHTLFVITIGKKYVARVASKNNQWCRVRVDNTMEGTHNYKVICHLIDYGIEVIVDRKCLRQVHLRYFDLPAQVKSVSLANIVPAALETDIETFNTELRPSDKWSIAATEFLKSRVMGRMNVTVTYMPGSQHKVIMSVGGDNVNNELIGRKLAMQKMSVLPEGRKIRTFSESQEMERQLEEEEQRRAAGAHGAAGAAGVHGGEIGAGDRYQGSTDTDEQMANYVYRQEMDLPQRLTLGGAYVRQASYTEPTPSRVDVPSPVLAPRGRGQKLLEALGEVSAPGRRVTQNQQASPYQSSQPPTNGGETQATMTLRLPRTQSIAQTCSPPRPTVTKDQLSPNRPSAGVSPRMALLSQLAHSSSSDNRSQISNHSSPDISRAGSDIATDNDIPNTPSTTQVEYNRSRRPNLNKSKSPLSDQKPITSSPTTAKTSPPAAVSPSHTNGSSSSRSAEELTVDLKNLLGVKPKMSDNMNTGNSSPRDTGRTSVSADSDGQRNGPPATGTQPIASAGEPEVTQYQDARPKTILKTTPESTRHNMRERGAANISYSSGEELTVPSKLRRGVSFSDTDEIKEFTKDSMVSTSKAVEKLSMSSGGESDDMSFEIRADGGASNAYYLPDTKARIYEKRLQGLSRSQEETINGDGNVQLRSISYDQSKAIALKKQATVFSDLPITPIFNIHKSKLHDRVLRHWRSLGGSEKDPLRTLQAYGWPSLRRGMEMVAITDPFIMEGRDGVSLTYVMAAATLMFDVDSYVSLPKGGGPRCLILCASWSKAEQIYFHVSSIFGDKSLLVLHGRRETENKLCCDLVNGTDVIVSTPCTFIRMLESGHTNVKRLCHLFIDDADIITQEFPKQLSDIMKEVGLAVNENVERAAPRQIALFSSTWTPLIGKFRSVYMTASATIITNKIEASIACNVKQWIHYIDTEEQRLSTLLKLVAESGSPAIKLVVCTHTEADATKVYSAIHSYSHEVYLALKSNQDVDNVMKVWEAVRSENSYPILVITDEVLHMLIYEDNPVIDAQYVLHYNMPANKRLLGLRLHCMSAHYAENTDELMLASHIIFTPTDHQTSTTIVRILDRLSCEVPHELRQLSITNIERNETGKKKELCHYMKSYGVCRDQLKCPERHLVSTQLDTPANTLPTAGDIEFKVISVRDAVTSYARLTRHRDVNGVLHTVPYNKLSLDLALSAHFNQKHVKICLDPDNVERDRLCVYEHDNVYYRTRIIEAIPGPDLHYPPAARVLLLDEGRIVKVETRRLYELPPACSLQKLPLEIVEIRICKLKPEDHDVDWSSEANAFMSQMLQGEVLSGKIQLCLGTTIWCDPIVKREYLKDSALWVSLWYAGLKLLGDVNTGHLASKNPEHINLLRKACDGKITLPNLTKPNRLSRTNELVPQESTEQTGSDITVSTRQLNESELTPVYISEVDDPELLFVIRTDQHDRLMAMEELLNAVMKKKGRTPLDSMALRSLCVAKYPDQDGPVTWCRCSVLSFTAGKLLLLALDYGRMFQEQVGEISGFPSEPADLMELPFQAIECHLPSVMPSAPEWGIDAGDLIYNHLQYSYTTVTKVLSTKPSKFTGDLCYGIDLIDQTEKGDISMSQLLINQGLGVERKLDILKRLGLDFETDELDYPFEQIPKLIRLLNRTENHEKRLLICEYIRSLVYQSNNLKHEMRTQGIIKKLCTLINTVNLHHDLLYHILDCLVLISTKCQDNCEEIWWEKGFSYLHGQLEICDDNSVLTKVLACLQQLIKNISIQQEVDELEEFTSNLIHIARSSTILNNKITAMDILNSYVNQSKKRVELLVKQGIVSVLQSSISVSSDEIVQSAASLIYTLVTANGKQSSCDPWTETLTKIADCMFKVATDQGLCVCAKALYAMLRSLQDAADMLKSSQLHEKLQRLINSGLNAATREACLNVLLKVKPEELKTVLPPKPRITSARSSKPQTIDLTPLPKGMPVLVPEASVPTVYWWETTQFVMIQVQVHDALTLNPTPQLHCKNQRLDFKCGNYQFKLGPLYGPISSRRSQRKIMASEIQYALYKESAGLWSKLLSPGHKKPSFVQPNMDMMVTSSDEECEIEDISPFDYKPQPTLRYNPFETMRGVPPSLPERPKPAEEYVSSPSDASSENDERFDTEYRKTYDFFNL